VVGARNGAWKCGVGSGENSGFRDFAIERSPDGASGGRFTDAIQLRDGSVKRRVRQRQLELTPR
jgi:hypothetical protein